MRAPPLPHQLAVKGENTTPTALVTYQSGFLVFWNSEPARWRGQQPAPVPSASPPDAVENPAMLAEKSSRVTYRAKLSGQVVIEAACHRLGDRSSVGTQGTRRGEAAVAINDLLAAITSSRLRHRTAT